MCVLLFVGALSHGVEHTSRSIRLQATCLAPLVSISQLRPTVKTEKLLSHMKLLSRNLSAAPCGKGRCGSREACLRSSFPGYLATLFQTNLSFPRHAVSHYPDLLMSGVTLFGLINFTILPRPINAGRDVFRTHYFCENTL